MPEWARNLEERLLRGRLEPTDHYWLDPTLLLKQVGKPPDPWQEKVLRSTHPRLMLLCSRQVGKSTVAGAFLAKTLLIEAPSFCLVLAQNAEKSQFFLETKLRPLLVKAGAKFAPGGDLKMSITLANGSRVFALPGSEKGVRGYDSVDLLLLDEASRIPDELYFAVRPMLGVSKGRLLAASTPFGKRGWFFDEWERGADRASGLRWHRERITAYQCPRYTREFLEEEKASMGERWFRQEYLAVFEDPIGAVFSDEDIRAAFRDDVTPMIPKVASKK